MKNFRHLTLLVLTILSVLTGSAQRRIKRQSTLEVSGVALLNDSRIRDYNVSVFLDGKKVDSMYTRSVKPVFFTITYNKVYTLLFQKEGCNDKMVILNTHVPKGLKDIKEDTFDFEIEMSQALTKDSKEIEDYPVAVLLINRETESFEQSTPYYNFTHKENVSETDVFADLINKINIAD